MTSAPHARASDAGIAELPEELDRIEHLVLPERQRIAETEMHTRDRESPLPPAVRRLARECLGLVERDLRALYIRIEHELLGHPEIQLAQLGRLRTVRLADLDRARVVRGRFVEARQLGGCL